MTEIRKTGLELLREPFAPHQISQMCRSTKKDNPKSKCPKCGGYHGLPAVQLSYVGHAALTDRLLDADPAWTWEPLSCGPDGYPVIDKDGGMWIKLTVCGVTRLGYGDNQNRQAGDGMKERIGDALRNAAMRFGAALDLWHKGDLHVDEDDKKEEHRKPPKTSPEPRGKKTYADYQQEIDSLPGADSVLKWKDENVAAVKRDLSPEEVAKLSRYCSQIIDTFNAGK
jgi:hypothetical protein